MSVAIKGTTKFRFGYPAQQNPRRFKLYAGRSSGTYGTVFEFGDGHTREILCDVIDYDGLGTYFVKINSIDYSSIEEDGVEFEVDLQEPTDTLAAPIGPLVW